MITDLICKLQQKFDYIFFVVLYIRTFGILLMSRVLESFFIYFLYIFRKDWSHYIRRCDAPRSTEIIDSYEPDFNGILVMAVSYGDPLGSLYQNNCWNHSHRLAVSLRPNKWNKNRY